MSVKDSDERPWDEQDDDDDDTIICNGDGGGGGGEEKEKGVLTVKRDHKRRRRRVLERREEEEEGLTDYPLDLWFCISEYIRPEDVGRFASLCQATRYITTTVQFWLSMFRRYYQWTANLPDSLNYWNLDRRMRDVRVCVIRALFLMYAPFQARLAAEKPLSADPTQLLRAQCILQWHRKDGPHHKYFFKFAHTHHCMREDRLAKCVGEAPAHTNPHNGCWVLEATSAGVCAVPMVMGEHLYHAGVGVSANLCSHTLRLALVPPHLLPPSSRGSTRRHRVPATEITLDPVSNVRLYPWWHPEYWNLLQISHSSDKDDW
ncbi:transmembrane protein 183-like [Portunus trituberculatus]|uniref:transmembrane protein 183-like n=1 Tax=Portunus trituberculatus TaxID=210409 RepID=UPI001E1CD861|nr:transmembrane protein 183-like [Portunus trituberculatus]